MSSLAAQLAQNASLNTALLVDRSRRKAAESYLFTGREADQYDLESIHALGVNALLHLAQLSPSLRKYEDQLFSDYAKASDRTLLSTEANAQLDAGIGAFLALLGSYVMEAPTGKILEWLVRRFRINEFNVEAVLSLFLPYHESPHFTKMLSILHIKQNSTWSFLLPFKSAAQNLPRMSLVTEMLRNTDVSRFVTSLLPAALKDKRSHRVLLAFNAACLHDFISRSQAIDAETIAYLLPALLGPLQSKVPIKNAILGSYVLLAALSQKCRIAPAALSIIVNTMTTCAEHVLPQQYMNAILSLCEPQDELESFSEATLKAVLRIPSIEKELRAACNWIGVEKILNPLVRGLLQNLDEDRAVSALEALIATSKIPQAVIRQATAQLIQSILTENVPSEATTARRLLAAIQQRHPVAFQESMDNVTQEEDVEQEIVNQLRISLTVVGNMDTGSSQADSIDMVLASTNAAPKVRAAAVTDLLSQLCQTSVLAADTKSIHSALLARVQDTNQSVIDTLYNKPSTILPVLSGEPMTYVSYLSTTLAAPGSKPKRNLLRAHIAFLSTHFSPANPPLADKAFQKIVFPFLLFSKPRQHSAEVVWDIIASQKADGVHEWLVGCGPVVTEERAKDTTDAVEKMSNINMAFSTHIARNILKSNNYSTHLETLIAKLKDDNSHTRVLGYLIARALLTQLSGEHQVEAGHRVLDVIDVAELEGMEGFPQEIEDFIGDATLFKVTVTKPSSRSTLQRLQLGVVALLPSIQRPTGLILNWLASNPETSSNERGSRYVELIRKVYKLANVSSSVPDFTTGVLQTLFINLKSDALAFLAGIWTDSTDIGGSNDLRTVALNHAAAFFQAHVLEDDGVDFQTILPALLVALQSSDVEQRNVALTCISSLRQLADRKFTTVYGFDVIYGASEDQIQYLDRDDLKTYLSALVEHRDHLSHDVEYIKVFHQQHLGKNKSDKKKSLEYKRRILCFIISHVNALAFPTAQIALLKSIGAISDSAKAEILSPTIKSLVASKKRNVVLQDLSDLVMSFFDASVAKDLNDEQGALWDVYVSVMRFHFTPAASISSQENIARALEVGLFSALSAERKLSLCNLLLEIGAHDTDAYAACKQLLIRLVEDVPLIVHILGSLQPSSDGSGQPAMKRAKTTYTSEDTMPRLGLFVEVLGARSLPGSLDLISNLLETLNRVSQSATAAQTDVSYTEQLLMSAIENAASKEIPNLTPSVIRLEILVELIRVSDNPQTFHQALFLMANLARLAPDSVLHNVMPVFTFMGSNVFHRDDAYSFKVVQQTVDSIVPVMVASLKRSHVHPLDLYIGSKDFLRVFTDAANHIPRHRRTNFFAHLTDVLGSGDFLPPVCMLLVEKVANRVIKRDAGEIQASFSLPAAVLQHNPASLQIRTLTILLHESKRLANRILHPDNAQPTFLEVSSEDASNISLTTLLRRRSQALILFVGHVLKPSVPGSSASKEELSQLVETLISPATLQAGITSEGKIDEISQAARTCLNKALSIMAASDFINGISSMIEAKDKLVQSGALELLSDRLPQVTDKTRVSIVPIIVKITGVIRNLLSSQANETLTRAAYKALRSIGLTMCPSEESCLTEVVPLMLISIRGRNVASAALSALSPLPTKIGPRIIPHFREIIAETVAIIREGTSGMQILTSPRLALTYEPSVITEDAYSVLHGLLISIPTFWGPGEITQIIMLYVEHCTSTSNSPSQTMLSLMKALAKRAPPNERFIAYFDVLARSLRSAARPAILEHGRPLFKVFLEGFDLAHATGPDAEARAILAFQELVVKLNEAAFRPLFRRLYDWAFANDTDDSSKKITFCHIYIALLDFFKGLMNPYMSFLLAPFVETLRSYTMGASDDPSLWAGVVETLTKSLSCDDGAFWRDDKLRQLAGPLVQQLPVCLKATPESKTAVQDCLVALVDNVTDDMLLKSVNLDVLMHTRSDDVRLRLLALTCSEKLWRVHGGKLLGFATETTTFIAECTEDENDTVVRESFKLKDAVESVAGNINGL
ncbi:hypothetical protein DXG01_001782 [Tephrocybe rancida]|nr:hypothetical protein DXG01_001782 [Tephrocybe rancida]